MVHIVTKMTNQNPPLAYLILLGLYETADIIYYNHYKSTISKEKQRKPIFKDLDRWFWFELLLK